jgi:hypothetical protein
MSGLGTIIARRLRDELKLPVADCDAVSVERTYAGRNQREAGAWTWCLVLPDGPLRFGSREVGSIFPAKRIARCKTIEIVDVTHDLELFPTS